MDASASLNALMRAIQTLEMLPSFDEESLETALRDLAGQLGLKAGQLFGIIRITVTGKPVAPPLFGTLSVLGQERALTRLRRGEQLLSRLVGSGGK